MPEVRVEEVDEDFPKVNIACEIISFESNTVQKPYGNNSIAEGKLFEGLKRFLAAGFKGIAVKTMKKKKRIDHDELEDEEEELLEKKKKKKKKKLLEMQEHNQEIDPIRTKKRVQEKTHRMVEHGVERRGPIKEKGKDRGGR